MRIRVIRKPVTACIDGIQLDRFEPGREYDIDHRLGALFLAEGWADAVPPEAVVPQMDPFAPRKPARVPDPPNLVRETGPAPRIWSEAADMFRIAPARRQRKSKTRKRTPR